MMVNIFFQKSKLNIKDGSVSLEEWQQFLISLHLDNENDLEAVLSHWKNNAFIDIGDGVIAPIDKKQASKSWQFLAAGGIAGVISRTVTAPIDRLKTLYQIQVIHEFNSSYFLSLFFSQGRYPEVCFRVFSR
jgi:hypothetical protein